MFTQVWWKHATALVIIAGVVFYVFWDCLAFYFGGPNGAAAESTTVGTWMDDSVWLCIAIGVLVFHLAASGPANLTFRHAIAAVIGGVIAYVATRLS